MTLALKLAGLAALVFAAYRLSVRIREEAQDRATGTRLRKEALRHVATHDVPESSGRAARREEQRPPEKFTSNYVDPVTR